MKLEVNTAIRCPQDLLSQSMQAHCDIFVSVQAMPCRQVMTINLVLLLAVLSF